MSAKNPFGAGPPDTSAGLGGGRYQPNRASTSSSLQPQSSTDPNWINAPNRPSLVNVANPPVQMGNVNYGPSYSMSYQPRSTADKSAVKYNGFLPLEGTYKDDDCRIG